MTFRYKGEELKTSLNEDNQLISTIDGKQYLHPIPYNEGGTVTDFINTSEEALATHKEYTSVSDEFKFRRLPVYGTTEKPYFLAKCVYEYIYPNGQNYKRYIAKFSVNDMYDSYCVKTSVIVPKKKGSVQQYSGVHLLNETGIMKAMFMATTPFAVAFQEIVLGFLKKIRTNHKDIFVKELEASRDDYIARLNKAESERQYLEEAVCNNAQVAVDVDFLKRCIRKEDDVGMETIKRLSVLEKLYLKPVMVYIIREEYAKKRNKIRQTKSRKTSARRKPRKPRKKNQTLFDDSSDSTEDSDGGGGSGEVKSGDESDENEYELSYNSYNAHDLKSYKYSNDDFYFIVDHWSSKTKKPSDNYHHVLTLQFVDKENYNKFMVRMKDKSDIPMRNAFKCTFLDIADAYDTTFQELYTQPMFDEMRARLKFMRF